MRLESSPTTGFQDLVLPRDAELAGWARLVAALRLQAPVRFPSAVSRKHVRGSRRETHGWQLFDKRYAPGDTFQDHLTFALKHEDIDLLILKRAFEAVPKSVVEEYVRSAPTGGPTRRAWFLYETLSGETLDVKASPEVAAIDVLDPRRYLAGRPRPSARHRVRDNLLGSGALCPVVRRTETLERLAALDLAGRAAETIGQTSRNVVARAASFMLLADSRASFEIEGERPPRNRIERWGRAVLQAGRNELTLEEILRLHTVLIEDFRFVQPGLRTEGVFLGERDQDDDPLPEFIGARPEDLDSLMAGLLSANDRMRDDAVDPVIQAAATAFGFVFMHPFGDGNGRLHRCLIHHVLAERKFTPPGMVFPVSSVMLDRIDDYRSTLQAHSGPLMNFVEWRPTAGHNVEVLNDTSDLYRYFDATEQAEFLYSCVQRTVENDLPREIEYLRCHDLAMNRIMSTVELPDRLAQNFIIFVRRNHGTLPSGRREGEFAALTDDEVRHLEEIVVDAFASLD